MPTESLKAQLANTLGLTARHLMRLAVIVAILEDRGEDLSALKSGFLVVLRKIAAGELLPDLVVLFAAEPAKIQQASKLPVERQAEIIAGRAVLPARRNYSDHRKPQGQGVRVDERQGLVVHVGELRLDADPGDPKAVGRMAAQLVLSCVDKRSAMLVLVEELKEGGVELPDQARMPLPRSPERHPPGYWLDRTKHAD